MNLFDVKIGHEIKGLMNVVLKVTQVDRVSVGGGVAEWVGVHGIVSDWGSLPEKWRKADNSYYFEADPKEVAVELIAE